MPVIMVVDDDPSILELLRVTLADLGRVVCLESGEAAVEWAADQLPDIVVLDVSMPGMSGLDVVRTWREDERTADLDIILLSGLDDPKDQAAGYNAGADAYVTKPVNVELLESMIAAMFAVEAADDDVDPDDLDHSPDED